MNRTHIYMYMCVHPYALHMNEIHSFYKCACVCLYKSVHAYTYGQSLHMSIIYIYALLFDTYTSIHGRLIGLLHINNWLHFHALLHLKPSFDFSTSLHSNTQPHFERRAHVECGHVLFEVVPSNIGPPYSSTKCSTSQQCCKSLP